MRPLIFAILGLFSISSAHAQSLRFHLLSNCLTPRLVLPSGSIVRAPERPGLVPHPPRVFEPLAVQVLAVPAGRPSDTSALADALAGAYRTVGATVQVHAACLRGALVSLEDASPDASSVRRPSETRAGTPQTQRATAAQAASERRYIRGTRGVCYYVNDRGGREYVDRWFCK